MKDLPIYKVEISEDDELTGVDFISLVDQPAMEVNWLKFNKEEPIEMLFQSDKVKKMLYGVFITADTPIERYDEKIGSYYCVFEKETITQIMRKFNKNNFNKNVNFQHGDNMVSAFVVENFQTSPLMKTDFGFEVKEGSWVGSIYIEDDVFWNNYIKTDKLTGFSIELISKLTKYEDKVVEDFSTYDEIEKILKDNEDYEVVYSKISTLLKDNFESYDDYPQAASENAKIALRWVEENGWGSCGTPVGKTRANQLANGEKISRDTIARMAAFERHRQNSNKKLGDGCGRLMWLAWGGDEGVEWATRKLNQIKNDK